MRQQVTTLIPWLIAVYATICVVVYFGNRLFMYFPNPTRAAPAEAGLDHVKEIKILVADGVTLVAWYAPAGMTSLPFFTSTGTPQTPPIARPELH